MTDNPNQDINVNFKFASIGSGDVIGAYDKLQKRLDDTRKATEIINKVTADKAKSDEIIRLGNYYGQLASNLEDSNIAARQLAKELANAGATAPQIKLAADEFERMKKAQSGLGGSSGGINFGTLARSATGLGFGGVGGIANAVDDFSDLGRQVQMVLGGVGGGFSSLVAVAGPVIGILGLATIAQNEYNNAMKASHDAFAQVLIDEQKRTDLLISNISAARNTTSSQNIQNAEDQQKAFEIQRQRLEELEKQKAAVDAKINSPLALLDTLIGNRRGVDALRDQSKQLDTAILDATTRLKDMGDAVTNTVTVLGPEVEIRQKERDAIEAAKKATEERQQAEKDAAAEQKKVDAEIEQARKQLTTVSEQLADVEKRRTNQLANRVQEDQRALEIGSLEGQIKAAQEQEQAQANADKITAIRAEGGDAEAKALMNQAARIQSINDNFFVAQQRALQNYVVSEQRATEDYNRERVRKLQDLNATLLNLAGARDVAGFVNARSAGLTDIARGDEDAGTASQRRREDYERQAREADDNRRRQLESLRVANEQENTERRTALNARIQQEIAAGQGQLKQSQVLQNQLAALRQRYAVQDLAARRANEDAAYTEQVGKLKARQTELNNIIGQTLNPAVSLMSQLGAAVVNFINQVYAAAVSNVSTSASDYVPPGGSVATSYASGTNYVPRTGLYRLHQGEAVVPASRNRNYSPAWSGGRSGMVVNINNPMFGAIATPADVAAGKEWIVSAIEQAAGVA